MKKKNILIAIATALAVGSTHVSAATYDESSTETEINYTAMGVGATTGGLLFGPVGILVGGIAGSLYDSNTPEDSQQTVDQSVDDGMASNIEKTTESVSDALVKNPEPNEPEGLMLASSSDDISFIDEELAEESVKDYSRIKEIITNDLSVIVHFKPGSVNFENFYSQQFSTVSNLLHEMPEMELNLDGYSDRQGAESDNLQLSTERLESVRDYFVKNGIDANRVNINAYGEKDFLSTPGELDSYVFDRRVVVSFKAPIQIPKNNIAVVSDSSLQ